MQQNKNKSKAKEIIKQTKIGEEDPTIYLIFEHPSETQEFCLKFENHSSYHHSFCPSEFFP